MADKPSLNDRFAGRTAPGARGFVGAGSKDSFAAKAPPPPVDAFATVPKKTTKPAPAARPKDAFAAKRPPAQATASPAPRTEPVAKSKPSPARSSPLGAAFAGQSKTKVTPPAPKRSGMTAPVTAPAEKLARPKSPALQPVSSPRPKSAMVKPAQTSAPVPKSAMVMLGAAGLAAPKAQGASKFYNPFDQKKQVAPAGDKSPGFAPPRDKFDPLPQPEMAPAVEAAEQPETTPPLQPKRALHVVTAPERPVSAIANSGKQQRAARASSLVLVSGAGAVTAAAETDAPAADKPSEAVAPAAEAPPPPAPEARQGERSSGGGGGGSGAGGRGGTAAVAKPRRGLNQDDLFGIVFGIAALIFLLLWFMRGKGGEAAPGEDLLATPQSAGGQALASLPAAPKPDPFGDAPVDLKPSGPIPETPADMVVAPVAPPAAVPTPASASPAAASPAPVAPNPEASLPIAERKMHAWFCTASSRLTKPSRTELTGELAKFEDVFKGKELVVRGYADTRGSTELNADLGTRRAQTVADYLTAKGLSVVDVQGVGELEGLDDNQNCPNQRRVDVWVKGGPAETPSRACAPEPEVESLICG